MTRNALSLSSFLLTSTLVLLLTASAHAAPIVLDEGESAIFNFDFISAGVTPAPPNYDLVFIYPQFNDFGAGDSQSSTLFGDLDATGVTIVNVSPSSYPFISGNVFAMRDGIFSLLITATSGQFSVDPYAFGRAAGLPDTAQVIPTVSRVPSPAPLALFGIVVVGLGVRRLKRFSP